MSEAVRVCKWSTRRLGEATEEKREAGEPAKGGAEKGVGRRGKNAGYPTPRIPTLEDQGVAKNLAHAARSAAAMGEDKFRALRRG